jgi:hypothetical protein
MLDDEAYRHVEDVFSRGGIGIFTLDETRSECEAAPATMPADVFTSCTHDIGLPTRRTTNLDEFDPSRPLDVVYLVRALAPDGTMRWFGIVGLGPRDHYGETLGVLRCRSSAFGVPPSVVAPTAASAVEPRFFWVVAPLIMEAPALYGAVLGIGAAAVAMAADPGSLAKGLSHVMSGSALSASASSEDADRCRKAVVPFVAPVLPTRCLQLSSDEITTSNALASFWYLNRVGLCAYNTAYITNPGHPFETTAGKDPETRAFYNQDANVVAWNRDKVSQPSFSGFVMPHEFGHVVQAFYPQAGQQYARNVPSELQADCLAGVFAGANRIAGVLALSSEIYMCDVMEGTDKLMPNMKGYSETHGTCTQRAAAFTKGYKAALANAKTACTPSTETSVWALTKVCQQNQTWYELPTL